MVGWIIYKLYNSFLNKKNDEITGNKLVNVYYIKN